MAKKKKSKNKKKQLKLNTDMKVILLILLGIILAILIYGNSGYVGNFLNEILGGMVGIFKYLVPIVPFISAIYMVSNNKEDLLEYEINSARTILLKKQNTLEEDEIIAYLKKKGYLSERIKIALEE